MKNQLLLAALLASLAFTASAATAPNTLPKEDVVGAPGACHGSTWADVQRLRYSALSVSTAYTANVACSPRIDVSQNGSTAFGAVLSNGTDSALTMTCTALISSGGNGARAFTRSVIVDAHNAKRITWYAADMGFTTLYGGQVGFTCTLRPGTALSWIWSTGTSN
jgi:hypothetical protein